MADIDKSLPNVKTSIEVDPQEEIEIEQEKALEAEDPGVEVTPNKMVVLKLTLIQVKLT